MNKKQWIIFSIVISFLSLIFSILTYFGIIRYINMYIFSSSSYANSYKTLERAKNDKVVINIMINPDKHSISSAVINSLLDQTVKVDEINIFSDNPITLPDTKGIVKRHKTYKNYCSTIPCIMKETNKNTIIIFLNDNKIYGKDFIQDLIESDSEKNCAISCGTSILTRSDFFDIDTTNINIKDHNMSSDDFIKKYLSSKSIPIKHIDYNENYNAIF